MRSTCLKILALVASLGALQTEIAFGQKQENAQPQGRDTVFLEGFINADQSLSPGKVYALKHNVKVVNNATLTVPGKTTLVLDFGVSIVAEGGLNFNGSPGSWIEVKSKDPASPGKGILVRGADGKDINIQYTRFSQVEEPLKFDTDWYREKVRVENNIFTGIFTGEPVIYIVNPSNMMQGKTTSFIFSKNSYISNWGSIFIDNLQSNIMDLQFTDNLLTNNVVYAINQGDPSKALIYGLFDDEKSKYRMKFSGNSIFGNYQINSSADTIIREVGIGIQGTGESLDIPDNFFRSSDPNYVSSTFDHFYQNSNLPLLKADPVAASPGASVHPHIWKVNLNGKDIINYSTIPASASRDAMFEVYFNKPVDLIGDRQFESIIYDTAKNELVINPVQVAEPKWSPDHMKYSFKVSNASFLNNQVGYVVISNFKDNEGIEVPDFTIGQPRALNNFRAIKTGGRKTTEIITKADEGTGLDADIDKGAFLTSKEQVTAFRQLTNLGDLSYLGPFESLSKRWELGLQLGASNYTGTYTDRLASRDHYRFSGGIFGQYNAHKWFSLRAMIWLGKISGGDLDNSGLNDRARLGHFKNFIVEGTLTFVWHLLPYGSNRGERFVPALFAGIGLFRNNPMSRVFLTLDREGEPMFLRWNPETDSVAVDWRNNSDGYNESKDIWISLRSIGTEGQTVDDKTDPESVNSPTGDENFFAGRTAPKKYKKVQVCIPIGFEFSWIINMKWNIGATLGWRFTSTRYVDDVGGYFFDRVNNHQAIVAANPEIKGKAGREKISVPATVAFTDDGDRWEEYNTAALLANPSLVKTNDVTNNPDPNIVNYAYTIDQPYDNHEGRRTVKNFDDFDNYFFAGVKVSYIFRKKNERKEKPLKTDDAYDEDSDGDGISDNEEKQLGTDLKKADSDGDGLADKKELEAGADPKLKDSDKDGVSDGKDKCPAIAGSKKNDGCPE